MSDGSDVNSKDSAATPATTAVGGAARPRYDDEISLRELYLILRRGLPLIGVVTLVATVAAFAFVALQPDDFEAEATVVSSPTTVQAQDQGALAFSPSSSVSFDTYEAIATSRASFDNAIARLRDEDVDVPDGFTDLRGAAEVVRLSGPTGNSPGASLSVLHRITWSDPVLAAAYADAWAEATVDQVRATLLADLEPTRIETLRAIEHSEADLEASEAEFAAFAAKDLDGLRVQLDTLAWRRSSLQDEALTLDLEIARLAGEVAALTERSGAAASVPISSNVLAFLSDTGRLDPDAAATLRLRIPTDDTDPIDVAALLSQADVHSTAVELAGRLEEREAITAAIGDTSQTIGDLRVRLGELEQEELAVTRRLDNATAAYDALKAIEPALAFVADLTPSNTRVLNRAQEPLSPAGISPSLVALLAAVVAFLAATLFVFLREAVREPAESTAAAASTAQAARSSG